ncbi:coiled-coil-helix-coiled-coil-helix domain-containing protein 7 [Microplitis demolitor]|uniref:coiled-coil-helix-coiled-coil-helix domain-containing protein 7 n=1 Tax=Microplitis demolitor TaxID=69319 RepID=UPI0004CDB912|nr:coiled-coil-helix-coiled-coil-helix domain-containing protein 7 [Microplitis demolitor]
MPTGKQIQDSRLESPENNPCLKEHRLSLKCIADNYENKNEACAVYFDNYKACKKFWNNVYSDRKRRGVEPYLPPPDEREKIKSDYLSKFKK